MQIDHLLDIGQSETEALDVVDIARVDAVELLEDLLEVLFLDTLARVANGETEVVLRVPRLQIDVERLVGFGIFDGIVQEVEDDIAESTASMPV